MDKLNLHYIKRQSIKNIAINLYSFKEDKKKSTSKYPVLNNGKEEIFLKIGNSGFEIFGTRNNSAVSGTIIDFVMGQENCDFKQAVKIIKGYYNVADNYMPRVSDLIPISSPTVNYKKILNSINRYDICIASPYLFKRGIKKETLNSKRFTGVIRTKDNIVIFPHRNKEGFCGWEARSPIFKGFCKGGIKGVWVSNTFKTDENLVLTEGAIDALSYYQLYNPANTRYMSIGGRPSKIQKDLLKGAFSKVKRIYTAFDNGEGGDKLRDDISKLGLSKCLHHRPEKGYSDYNEQLTRKNM